MKNTQNPIDGDDLLDEMDDDETGDILSSNDPLVRGKIFSSKDISAEDLAEFEDSSDEGGESVSGEMPDLESDTDLLRNSQAVGLRLDEDDDDPKELDIAADVAAAEAERHGTSNVDKNDKDY